MKTLPKETSCLKMKFLAQTWDQGPRTMGLYCALFLVLKNLMCVCFYLAAPGLRCGCVCVSCSVLSDSLRPQGLEPSRLLHPWDFPGKNIGVGCHFLLQGIFPTQGSNPGLLHCRWILHCLSHQGSPKNTGVGSHYLIA